MPFMDIKECDEYCILHENRLYNMGTERTREKLQLNVLISKYSLDPLRLYEYRSAYINLTKEKLYTLPIPQPPTLLATTTFHV